MWKQMKGISGRRDVDNQAVYNTEDDGDEV